MPVRERQISAFERIVESERWMTSLTLPGPIHQHLDNLIETAAKQGAGAVSRQEIIAALICDAPADGPGIKKCLEKYRQAEARDLIRPVKGVVIVRSHGPGRR
jgi:hypothetical protein